MTSALVLKVRSLLPTSWPFVNKRYENAVGCEIVGVARAWLGVLRKLVVKSCAQALRQFPRQPGNYIMPRVIQTGGDAISRVVLTVTGVRKVVSNLHAGLQVDGVVGNGGQCENVPFIRH